MIYWNTASRTRWLFKSKIESFGDDIFSYLINLFELTSDSEKKSRSLGFAIEGFRENIFSDKEYQILRKIKIDNLGFAKILRTLFFIEGNIQLPFNVITPQQFGSIFESFLEFKLSKVSVTQYLVKRVSKEKIDIFWEETPKPSDGILYVAKRGSLWFRPDNLERKISGSYFTPDHVVDLIVRETLGPILRSRGGEEILKIRVCDPAMGSGHFLISALRYLTSEYLKKASGSIESRTSTKRKILHKCIFGVDKSRRAVKLGKLALWLETSEPGKALEHLDDQVKCGDTLIDDKLWKDWKEVGGVGFSAVIGNPPYVRAKVLGDEYRKVLNQKFESTTGIYDIYVCFIERAASLISEGGRIGFITPSKYIQTDFGLGLRTFISKHLCVDTFIDFSDQQLFEDATTYSAISIFSKRKQGPIIYFRFSDRSKSTDWRSVVNDLRTEAFTCIDKECLAITGWRLAETRDRVDRAPNAIKIEELVETIFVGLQLTPTNVIPVKIKGHYRLPLDPKKIYEIYQPRSKVAAHCEGKLLVPLLKSSDILTNEIQYDGWFAIFPYDSSSGFEIIKQNELKKHFPQCHKYLKSMKTEFDNRENGRWSQEAEWYQYSRVQNFDCHKKRKILVPSLAKTPRFAIDDGQYFIDQGSYGIVLKPEFTKFENYILSCLNSLDTKNAIEAVSPMMSGGYYGYNTKYLRDLDIPWLSEAEMILKGSQYMEAKDVAS